MSKIFKKTSLLQIQKKSAQRGFSNVQIAIGILVTVILLLGALSGYQYIQQSKVSNEVAMLTDLRTAIVRHGQVVGQFDTAAGKNAEMKTLIAMNMFNGAGLSIDTTANKVYSQWGGEVTVATGTLTTAGDSLAFTVKGVPSAACKEISTKLDSIVAKIEVGATALKSNGANSTLANVITGCGSAGSVDMVYTIAK